jgi:hypothetical protein
MLLPCQNSASGGKTERNEGADFVIQLSMLKIPASLLVAALAGAPSMLLGAQSSQSPDQQQEAKPKPSPKANQPESETAQPEPQAGQSPDTQQEKNGSTGSKQKKKSKNNARQGHGTSKPKSDPGAAAH